MSARNGPLGSSVIKKLATGITGLALVAFLVVHLIGNLTLFGGADMFNGYAHFLENLGHGMFVIVAEMGLIAFFVIHIAAGINIQLGKRAARPDGYYKQADAGGTSWKSKSSLNMIFTGGVLLVFTFVHLKHFKYGSMEMIVGHNGVEMKDLYTLVVASFRDWRYVVFYVAVMLLLGSHLMHGIWSAFQSLGATRPGTIPVLHAGGVAVGITLAVGFLLIPVLIFIMPGKFESKPSSPAGPALVLRAADHDAGVNHDK